MEKCFDRILFGFYFRVGYGTLSEVALTYFKEALELIDAGVEVDPFADFTTFAYICGKYTLCTGSFWFRDGDVFVDAFDAETGEVYSTAKVA